MSAETAPYVPGDGQSVSLRAPDPSPPHPSLSGLAGTLKSGLDVSVAALGLILLSPVFLAIAVLIKLDSPGPVFFRQRRVGLGGREFWLYKLRSMCADAEQRHQSLLAFNEVKGGVIFKMRCDPRVTRVGRILRKTSLDELPQLFNVLRRDMSLVGPRPLPTYEVARGPSSQHLRHTVLPGCTGLWQVSGRSRIDSYQRMVELDLEYIQSWSIALDLKILAKTFGVVARMQDSY